MDTANTSPAVLYARVFGVVLTLVGILGFFVTTSQTEVGSLLGFDVNLTHNIVHLLTGVLGLVAGFSKLSLARTYALGLGVVYLLVAALGFMDNDPLGLFVNINMADNFLHLAIAVAGLAAYAMSKDRDVANTTRV